MKAVITPDKSRFLIKRKTYGISMLDTEAPI